MNRFALLIFSLLFVFSITIGAAHTEKVNDKLNESVASAQLIISSLTGNREMAANVSVSEPTVSMNISGLTDGIHIVSLYINGQLADSCRLIKE